MSTVVELTKDNFKDTVDTNDLVLIDFWAAWCGPCKQFSPVYDAIAQDHSDVVFGKVNVDVEQGIAQQFNITSIPTVAVIKNGTLLHQQPGALTKQSLVKLVDAAKTVKA